MSDIYIRVDDPKEIVKFVTTWGIQEALTEATEYTATVSSVAAAVQVDGPRTAGTWRNASDGSSGTAPATAGNPLYETDGIQVAGDDLAQVLADIALALNAWWTDATNGATLVKRNLKLVATVEGSNIVFNTSDNSIISNMTEVTESGAFTVSSPVEVDLGHTDTKYYFNPALINHDTLDGDITFKDASGTAVVPTSGDIVHIMRNVSYDISRDQSVLSYLVP